MESPGKAQHPCGVVLGLVAIMPSSALERCCSWQRGSHSARVLEGSTADERFTANPVLFSF